ncbi:SIS domain-containing protein [Candidatus Woesebacteria bacterium]|nr:SIS domain-containing protein [Candidatus Woesebacteria bacterium]
MSSDSILDNRNSLQLIDKSNVLGSIEQLGNQVQHIWDTARSLHVDTSYKSVRNVVVAGMGGSALGTHVIQTVFKEELHVPVLIESDYSLPRFVDEHTLVIASSYSGTTEETLAATKAALQKGAKVVGITTGGELATLLKQHDCPVLTFEPKFNPSNQPRMALGYSVFGQIALFAQLGLLHIPDDLYQSVLAAIAQVHLQASVHVPQEINPAKLLAFQMVNKLPVITVAEHLEGAAHVFSNQLNENAKSLSELRVIPEINHHLMEGLMFPETNPDALLFLTVHSNLYQANNSLRMTLTEEVLEQNRIECNSHTLENPTRIGQAFELITFGSYANFYLAMLYNQDPAPIPWVDWFKDQLKKRG